MDAFFTTLLEKVSKRQIIVIAAMMMVRDQSLEQLIAIVVLAVAGVGSYTVLAWKHGPEKLNGAVR